MPAERIWRTECGCTRLSPDGLEGLCDCIPTCALTAYVREDMAVPSAEEIAAAAYGGDDWDRDWGSYEDGRVQWLDIGARVRALLLSRIESGAEHAG